MRQVRTFRRSVRVELPRIPIRSDASPADQRRRSGGVLQRLKVAVDVLMENAHDAAARSP